MSVDAFVGTYTDQEPGRIHTYTVRTGEHPPLTDESVISTTQNPSFLAIDPQGHDLYAVHENDPGTVTAFHVSDTGGLTQISRQPTGAAGPCHCSVHPAGTHLFVAHYTGAAVSVVPIGSDGGLESPSDVVTHTGSGPNPDRQSQAHPHSARPDPTGQYVYVPDLGTDTVVVYEFDPASGTLSRAGTTDTAPGAGPRHLDFHPTEPALYLINELDSTIDAYERDHESGNLAHVGTTTSVPAGFEGPNQTSEIRVHPSGRWVYGANRGHDSIAVFAVRDDLRLERLQTVSTGGAWPRHFTISPSGEMLLVGNQRSDEIVSFEIDNETGRLSQTHAGVGLRKPACLVLRDGGGG